MFYYLKYMLANVSGDLSQGASDLSNITSDLSNGGLGGGGGDNWLTKLGPFLMLGAFALVFYFFLLRPEQKKKKQAQEQRDAMKVGDTVITIGGITGEIEKIRNETITIYTGNCSMDVQKWAVRTIEADELTEEPEEKATKLNGEETKTNKK